MVLPFVFALHNTEEIFGMGKQTPLSQIFACKPVTIRQFGIAVTLFTLLGFFIVFGKGLYLTKHQYYLAIAGFAGMLLINVFFPHLLASILLKKYTPGVITGLFLNLPLTTMVLMELENFNILTWKQIIYAGILGGMVGALLVYFFLKAGYLVEKIFMNK